MSLITAVEVEAKGKESTLQAAKWTLWSGNTWENKDNTTLYNLNYKECSYYDIQTSSASSRAPNHDLNGVRSGKKVLDLQVDTLTAVKPKEVV